MRKINFKKIWLYPSSLKFSIIIWTFVFTLTLGYFFFLHPVIGVKKNIRFNLNYLENKLNQQQKISEEYDDYQKKIINLKKFFNVPSDESIDRIILPILSGQLISSNFDINEIKFLSLRKLIFLNLLKVKSDLLGTKDNIISFLYQISRLKYFILLNNFRWYFFDEKSKFKKQEISLSLDIYASYFNKKNFTLAIAQMNKVSIKKLSEKVDLTKYHLKNLKMIGFLSSGYTRKNWGIIALPNKQICKVKLGDNLGLEGGVVIAIYPQEIIIQEHILSKINRLSIENEKSSYREDFS